MRVVALVLGVLLLCARLAAGQEGKGEDGPVTLPEIAGGYQGTFIGPAQGTLALTVNEEGHLRGEAASVTFGRLPFSSQVGKDGSFSATIDHGGMRIALRGAFRRTEAGIEAAGVWEAAAGVAGTWSAEPSTEGSEGQTGSSATTGREVGPAEAAGKYHGVFSGGSFGAFEAEITAEGRFTATMGKSIVAGMVDAAGRLEARLEISPVVVAVRGQFREVAGTVKGVGEWEVGAGVRGTWEAEKVTAAPDATAMPAAPPSPPAGVNSAIGSVAAVSPLRLVKTASGERVVFAGREGPEYPEIVDAEVSPDGRRLAYLARKGKGLVVVQEGGQESATYTHVGELKFSPDGLRLAYRAKKGEGGRGGGWTVVVDGRERGDYMDVAAESPIFSPDGSRIAYVARHHAHRAASWRLFQGLWVAERVPSVVMVDEQEGPRLDDVNAASVTFSPDSRHVAYVGSLHDAKQKVFVDGQPGNGYDWLSFPGGRVHLVFSPDSRRVAYWAMSRDRGLVLVVDKDEVSLSSVPNGLPEPPIFSPDSRRIAYVVHPPSMSGTGNSVLLVDARQEDVGADILHLAFAPDSRAVSYLLHSGNSWYSVVGKQRTELRPEEVPSRELTPPVGFFGLPVAERMEPLAFEIEVHPALSHQYLRPCLPPMQTPEALVTALQEDVQTPIMSGDHAALAGLAADVMRANIRLSMTDPATGDLYGTNAMLSGKRISALTAPERTVMIYETRPRADGSRRVIFASRRVGVVSAARWSVLKVRSGLP